VGKRFEILSYRIRSNNADSYSLILAVNIRTSDADGPLAVNLI